MTKPTADKVTTGKHLRFFIQRNGPSPFNPTLYSGTDGQYMTIESTSAPVSGGVDPINVHSPHSIGKYEAVGTSISAPSLPSAEVTFMETHGGLPRQLYNLGDCPTNFYQVKGVCSDLSDFRRTVYDWVGIRSNGTLTDRELGGSAFDSDDAVTDPLTFVFGSAYAVAPLNFTDKAATAIVRAAVDTVFATGIDCGDCGPNTDGAQVQYTLVQNDSGTTVAAVVSSVNGVHAATPITASVNTESGVAIEVTGSTVLVLLTNGTNSYLYTAPINPLSGVAGTFVLSYTFTAQVLTDMWLENPRSVWFVGEGGAIFHLQSIGGTPVAVTSPTAVDLFRIIGKGNTILAIGESGVVAYSQSRGTEWAVATVAPSANDLTAVAVMDKYLWIVADDTGVVYATANAGGTAWTQVLTTAEDIADMIFATDEVGYILETDGSDSWVWYTINGGASWERSSALPIIEGSYRMAHPVVDNESVRANTLAIAGDGTGTDGALLVGTINVIG
jgi:hypothetical protein